MSWLLRSTISRSGGWQWVPLCFPPSAHPPHQVPRRAQMLAFPLSSAESFPWKDAAVWKPVLGFLDGASAALQCRSCGLLLLLTVTEGISVFRLFVEFASSQFQAIAFFAVLAYLAVLLSCAVTSGHSFSKRRFRVLWPLKFLRSVAASVGSSHCRPASRYGRPRPHLHSPSPGSRRGSTWPSSSRSLPP